MRTFEASMHLESMPADYVTKGDLADLKSELKSELTSELKSELQQFLQVIMKRFEQVDTDIRGLATRLERAETTMLREFHDWTRAMTARVRVLEVDEHGARERLHNVEQRLLAVEERLGMPLRPPPQTDLEP